MYVALICPIGKDDVPSEQCQTFSSFFVQLAKGLKANPVHGVIAFCSRVEVKIRSLLVEQERDLSCSLEALVDKMTKALEQPDAQTFLHKFLTALASLQHAFNIIMDLMAENNLDTALSCVDLEALKEGNDSEDISVIENYLQNLLIDVSDLFKNTLVELRRFPRPRDLPGILLVGEDSFSRAKVFADGSLRTRYRSCMCLHGVFVCVVVLWSCPDGKTACLGWQ